MRSIKNHNFRLKEIFCMSALALVSATALMLTGCSEAKPLSDNELVNVLSEKLGEKVEITEQKELEDAETLPLLYSMKCSDGTEFTVKRMRMQQVISETSTTNMTAIIFGTGLLTTQNLTQYSTIGTFP